MARLRDFYRTHYRANRMAVVVVGDIVPADAERWSGSSSRSCRRGPARVRCIRSPRTPTRAS